MKSLIKSILILVLLISSTSCVMNIDGVKGNRNVTTQNRNISSDFVKINVSRGIDVLLTYGDELSLAVEADENLHEYITTEVKNGVLYISSEKNIVSAKARRIYLSALHINEIKTSSGAEVSSENTVSTDELLLEATSGSDINLRVKVNNLTSETTSGADIKLIGKANEFDARATSGSDINAYDLTVNNCNAKVTSGADIKIHVIEKLDAKATSGGDIKYKGNPKYLEQDESSSGKVKRM
ncbi:MAG: head GIN domain-containing protein [Bacteroidota bacterium]